MKTVARTLGEKLETLGPDRRARIEAETNRLHTEYLTLRDLRKARDLTQVELAGALGIRQATVAKYERQSDLLLSTLGNYVRALGGKLDLVVQFPGRDPVTLRSLTEADAEETSRDRARRTAGDLGKLRG